MAYSIAVGVALLLLLLSANYILSVWNFNRKYKLPPSVPGWPIVGNSLGMPFPAGMWSIEQAKKYGEM